MIWSTATYNSVPPPPSLKARLATGQSKQRQTRRSLPIRSTRRLQNSRKDTADSMDWQINLRTESETPTPPGSKPFPFTSLPHELQLQVFHHFLCLPLSLDYSERKDLADTILSMLLLSRSYYNFFAPSFYQLTLIRFRKPMVFAQSFLYVCTDLCLANLRYLECCYGSPFGGGTNITAEEVVYDTRKLTDLFLLYRKEFRNLQEFKLVYNVEYDYNKGRNELQDSRTGKNIPWHDRDRLWKRLDEMRMGVFSRFQRRMSLSTFKAFEVERGLVVYSWTTHMPRHVLKELSLTFKREGTP